MATEQHIELVAAIANRATPVSVGVGLSTFFGIEWDIWLKVLATAHLFLMMGYYSWKWRQEYKDSERDKNGS